MIMVISILTLFPDMFSGPFSYSIVKRAQEKELVKINLVNIRDFATDAYKTVDDKPYGGGVGMILKVDVIDRALQYVNNQQLAINNKRTVLLDPKGAQYTQAKAKKLSTYDHLILVCGHYEGVDERIRTLVDESISVGPYILTGGELPAMVLTDSVTRLITGVLKPEATHTESFSEKDILEPPAYTRPEEYKGMKVPEVLLSGNHAEIEKWKKSNSRRIQIG